MKLKDPSQARLDKVKRLGRRHQSCLWRFGWRMFSCSAVQHSSTQQMFQKGRHENSYSPAWGKAAVFCSHALIHDWCPQFIHDNVSQCIQSFNIQLNGIQLHQNKDKHDIEMICAKRAKKSWQKKSYPWDLEHFYHHCFWNKMLDTDVNSFLEWQTQRMTMSICCLDNQRKWCMILLVSCFDTGRLKHGSVLWIEPLSRGVDWLFQMCIARAHLCTGVGRGAISLDKPKWQAPSNWMS